MASSDGGDQAEERPQADPSERCDAGPLTIGSTTIRLEERDENHWLATQDGVPVEGRGEAAAEAAAEYCRHVGAMDE